MHPQRNILQPNMNPSLVASYDLQRRILKVMKVRLYQVNFCLDSHGF